MFLGNMAYGVSDESMDFAKQDITKPYSSLNSEVSLYRGMVNEKSKQVPSRSPAELERELGTYVTEICKYIKSYWKPPMYDANYTSVIRFFVTKDGSIYNVAIYKTSGDNRMDKSVIQAAATAAKFKPLPDLWEKESIELQMTFEYHTLAGSQIR